MILIGCPIYKREWILPYWFAAIEKQDYPLSDIGFVFITSPDDKETLQCLLEFSILHPEFRCFDIEEVDEEHIHHPDTHRTWSPQRYKVMANLRNRLLDRVKLHEPDKFFSLDSDIILEDPTTITQLNNLTDELDAVAPLMYMTPDSVSFPSVMSWVPNLNRAYRTNLYPLGTLFKADIIMAAVMMSKPVYSQTRYMVHRQGEDLGWSYDATSKGFDLYSASFIYCPHIMYPSHLDYYLQNGDSRATI